MDRSLPGDEKAEQSCLSYPLLLTFRPFKEIWRSITSQELINHDDSPQPPHTPVGPGLQVVPNEAGPGDEISEEEAEVVLDLDDPPQSPEVPEVPPDVPTEGLEDAPNQSLPPELSPSQDSHSNNPTNSNLAGYQDMQQPIYPHLMDDLSVRHSIRPRKPKVIWDPSDL